MIFNPDHMRRTAGGQSLFGPRRENLRVVTWPQRLLPSPPPRSPGNIKVGANDTDQSKSPVGEKMVSM